MKNCNQPRERVSGFTLIEILVVIAIISLLAALLFPVFSQARERARRISCGSNMRFVGMAIRQYSQDNDEQLPLVAVNNTGVSATNPYGWADGIMPYLKSPMQYQCPSDGTALAVDSNANGTTFDETGSVDFFYNSRLSGIEEAKLQYPGSTLMLGDATPGDARTAYDGGSGTGPLTPGPAGSGNIRHAMGSNYAFADGHVKWLRPDSVLGGGASPNGNNYTFGIS
jgi:prepilin-type N-terminal cleavage/methylation domain-containing protein/prepilin-type processing-associated H-X9-DG protein